MRQAPDTAETYLRNSVKAVDDVFGDGYAKAHPELLAAMLRACTDDFRAVMLSNSIDRVADAIHSGLSNMAG